MCIVVLFVELHEAQSNEEHDHEHQSSSGLTRECRISVHCIGLGQSFRIIRLLLGLRHNDILNMPLNFYVRDEIDLSEWFIVVPIHGHQNELQYEAMDATTNAMKQFDRAFIPALVAVWSPPSVRPSVIFALPLYVCQKSSNNSRGLRSTSVNVPHLNCIVN